MTTAWSKVADAYIEADKSVSTNVLRPKPKPKKKKDDSFTGFLEDSIRAGEFEAFLARQGAAPPGLGIGAAIPGVPEGTVPKPAADPRADSSFGGFLGAFGSPIQKYVLEPSIAVGEAVAQGIPYSLDEVFDPEGLILPPGGPSQFDPELDIIPLLQGNAGLGETYKALLQSNAERSLAGQIATSAYEPIGLFPVVGSVPASAYQSLARGTVRGAGAIARGAGANVTSMVRPGIARAASASDEFAHLSDELLTDLLDDILARPATEADRPGTDALAMRLSDEIDQRLTAGPDVLPAGGFREGVSSRPLPPSATLTDNFLKPLDEYTDKLFHETSIVNSGAFTGTMQTDIGEVFTSNTANLARGQGGKGVLFEFSTEGIQGQIRKKPAWELAWENGEAEFYSRHTRQSQWVNNLVSLTIDAGAQGPRPQIILLKRTVKDWQSVVNVDGSTTYFKPQTAVEPSPPTSQTGAIQSSLGIGEVPAQGQLFPDSPTGASAVPLIDAAPIEARMAREAEIAAGQGELAAAPAAAPAPVAAVPEAPAVVPGENIAQRLERLFPAPVEEAGARMVAGVPLEQFNNAQKGNIQQGAAILMQAKDEGITVTPAAARNAAKDFLGIDLPENIDDALGVLQKEFDLAPEARADLWEERFPSAKPAAAPSPAATTDPQSLRYDPQTNTYNDQKLTRGDLLEDDSGNVYKVERASGFEVTLDIERLPGQFGVYGTVSVDPTNSEMFSPLFRQADAPGRTPIEQLPAAGQTELLADVPATLSPLEQAEIELFQAKSIAEGQAAGQKVIRPPKNSKLGLPSNAGFTGMSDETLRQLAEHEGLDPFKVDWWDGIDKELIRQFRQEPPASLARLRNQQSKNAVRLAQEKVDALKIGGSPAAVPERPLAVQTDDELLTRLDQELTRRGINPAQATKEALQTLETEGLPAQLADDIPTSAAEAGVIPPAGAVPEAAGVVPPAAPPPPVVPPSVATAAPIPPDDGAVQRVFNHISLKEPGEPIAERLSRGWQHFWTEMLDDLDTLKGFKDEARQAVDITPEKDPYIAGRLVRGNTAKADVFLGHGTFGKEYYLMDDLGVAKTNFRGPGLAQVLEPVKGPTSLRDFMTYLTSKRAVELAARNIETGIDQADSVRSITTLETKYPHFADVAKKVYKYQDDLLVYGQEMGLLDPSLVTKLREQQSYVPFHRVMDDIASSGFGRTSRKKLANIASPIKRIKGSKRQIVNPLESIVKNTYMMISAADRNYVGVLMAELAEEVPALKALFRKIPTPTTRVAQVTAKELGISVEGLSAVDTEKVFDVFRPSFRSQENQVTVLVNGRKSFYEVDPELYRSLLALNRPEMGLLMKFFGFPARTLRAGAILSPDFMIRNPVRDQFAAMAYSKYGFLPGVDFLKGISHTLGKSDEYLLYKMSGAEHSMLVSVDREYLQKSFQQVLHGKGPVDYVKNPLEGLQVMSELSEKGTRLGEFTKGLRAGATPTDAGFAARDLMDYNKMGSTARTLNQLIPFFNASIRGSDKMVTSFRNNPMRTTLKVILSITIPSLALYAINRNNPRYKEIPQWQKDLFWIIIPPGEDSTIIRIPKPFELGILFGSVPERMLEAWDTNDPSGLDEVMGSVVAAASPGFMPQAMLPFVENIANHSFFLDRPIVSRGREEFPPEFQFGPRTSETSKIIGKGFRSVPGLGRWMDWSPAKIDNVLKAWTAGLGGYVTSGLDKALEGTGIVNPPPDPEGSVADWPVAKAFVVRDPYGSGSASVDRFYKLYKEAEKHESVLKELMRQGEVKRFESYKNSHPEVLWFYDWQRKDYFSRSARYYRSIAAEFSKIRKTQQEVYDSRTMTPKEKREFIDETNRVKTFIAQQAVTMYKVGAEEKAPLAPQQPVPQDPTPVPQQKKRTAADIIRELDQREAVGATP